MKKQIVLGTFVVFALFLAACGTGTGNDDRTEVPMLGTPTTAAGMETATVVMPVASETLAGSMPTETKKPGSLETLTGSETPVIPVTGSENALNVSQKDGVGSFLVDSTGNTIYLYKEDSQNGTTSTCKDDCATNWMPVTATAETTMAGSGIDETKLGTITRDDGTMQVTYNGWPLYRYAEDMTPGDMNGQGKGGFWYMVSPEGEALTAMGG